MLAQAYTESGQTANAIALLEEAVAIEPSFYESLASAYEKDERWPEAARAYEQAAEQSPRDTALKTRWAFALLSMPDDSGAKRARDLLREVTKASPTEGWPLYLLARAERALGDLDASEASARRLMAISPGSTSGAHALAQVLEARRQWPALIEALEPVAAKPTRGARRRHRAHPDPSRLRVSRGRPRRRCRGGLRTRLDARPVRRRHARVPCAGARGGEAVRPGARGGARGAPGRPEGQPARPPRSGCPQGAGPVRRGHRRPDDARAVGLGRRGRAEPGRVLRLGAARTPRRPRR